MGLNPQVEAMKKSYHTACKEEKLAASRENNSKLESNNPEAQKKLQEKVEKCQQEVQKVQMCLFIVVNKYKWIHKMGNVLNFLLLTSFFHHPD